MMSPGLHRHLTQFFALCCIWASVGCSDSSTISINYDLPQPVEREVFRNAFYATMDSGIEKMGTIMAVYNTVRYSQEGPNLHLSRQFVMDGSKGYHKNSMPMDLAWRLPLETRAMGKQVHSIEGHQAFEAQVVDKLQIPDRFRNQLRGAKFVTGFDRAEKLRWEVTHLLEGRVPTEADITAQLHSMGKLPLPMVEVDSVHTQGFAKVEGVRCLQYTVFLREREPFPYFLWEQHAYGTTEGEALRNHRVDAAFYHTAYQVSIDPSLGIPCRERMVREGEHLSLHPQTGDTTTFRSQTTVEILYSNKSKR